MNLIFIAFAAWLVLRCYHPYPPSFQPHPLPNITATYIHQTGANGSQHTHALARTHAHTHNPCVSLSHPPSLISPILSLCGCLSPSPITLPVLVFDLQMLVGIMTTNQGWRWVITMWPTHPSWPFYSPRMMHLPRLFLGTCWTELLGVHGTSSCREACSASLSLLLLKLLSDLRSRHCH